MVKQSDIEEEFGESFEDVVRGYAEMGYGKDTTAKSLGYDVRGFRRLLDRKGWVIEWPAAGQCLAHGGLRGPYDRERVQAAREAQWAGKVKLFGAEGLSLGQWACEWGVKESTLRSLVRRRGFVYASKKYGKGP